MVGPSCSIFIHKVDPAAAGAPPNRSHSIFIFVETKINKPKQNNFFKKRKKINKTNGKIFWDRTGRVVSRKFVQGFEERAAEINRIDRGNLVKLTLSFCWLWPPSPPPESREELALHSTLKERYAHRLLSNLHF